MSETALQIDAAAADWAVRADRGLSADEAQALDAWLAADPRRVGAYGRMRAVSLHTERARALGSGYDPARFSVAVEQPAASRRRLFFVGGGLAAAVLATMAVGLGERLWSGRYITRRGEIKVVPLDDGSSIALNTDTQLRVSYTAARREVRLTGGEAQFDVAKDPSRPFVVIAGMTQVRAVGTSFMVRRLADGSVQVLVGEGVVEVRRKVDSAEPRPVRVAANARLTVMPSSGAVAQVAVAPAEITRELAWRKGLIALEDTPLGRAAEEFARYSDTRIVIDDPDVARLEISGLYQARDPVGFARAAATALDLQTEVGRGVVTIRR